MMMRQEEFLVHYDLKMRSNPILQKLLLKCIVFVIQTVVF